MRPLATAPHDPPSGPFCVLDAHPEPRSPLVFDSPHSGSQWPASATPPAVPPEALDTCWSAYVDALWAEAIGGSAPLLAAGFHRACIDPNRARDDIDPALLAETWPAAIVPCPSSHRGMGLIRRDALPGLPLYRAALSVQEVQHRIDQCYDPYHAALDRLISAAQARHGMCVHIVCLSMKSVGNAMNDDEGQARPDFVLSDLEGGSADPFLLRWMAAALGAMGHSVRVNRPYRGDELLRRHGRPGFGRHSVQIAVNRALYMHEAGCVRHGGYTRLLRHLAHFVRQLDAGLRAELRPRWRLSPPQLAQASAQAASPAGATLPPPCCAADRDRRAGAAHPCGWTVR